MKRHFYQRFLNKVRFNLPSKCWLWLASKGGGGYGRMRNENQKYEQAHRISYRIFVGAIPEGLTIDHLCKNVACVNPFHLEAVTMKENVMRSDGLTAQNARKVVCIQGHPFNQRNTYKHPDGSRACRTCRKKSHHKKAA